MTSQAHPVHPRYTGQQRPDDTTEGQLPSPEALRRFIVVAEELSFTRAAGRLNVAQQTLSEGIAQLEHMLGLRLFERTSRPVRLTDAAVRWLPHAREALAAVQRAQDAAVRLRSGQTGRLRVGLAATAAFPLTPVLLEAFRARHPQVALSTRHFNFGDPAGGLLSGETDVAIVRPPFSADGLGLLVIASEPRYVALSDQHPLARRPGVTFSDIEHEPWIEVDESDPVWCGYWRLTALRSEPLRVGANGSSLEDLLEAARTRQAIGVVAESVARAQPWPQLTFVKVTDIPASDVAIAWRTGETSPPVKEFITIARELAEPRLRGRLGPLGGRHSGHGRHYPAIRPARRRDRGLRLPVQGVDEAGRVDDLQPGEQGPDLVGAVVVQGGGRILAGQLPAAGTNRDDQVATWRGLVGELGDYPAGVI
jgi:DNA-binding transcriptional LysR family regulator